MSISIALTEDNSINRNTFIQKIKLYPDIHLLFIANNGNDCLKNLKGLPLAMMPKVIFMDIEMPEMDGIETIRHAKALYPEIHFIILTVFDDDDKIFEAIRSGASGYLLKHEHASTIYEAIVNVLEYGGAPMSPAIARKTLQLLGKSNSEKTEEKEPMPRFITDREQEILQHLVNGWDAKRIASGLNLSVLTVRKHIANIYGKLHVTSKSQIISMAHKNNWV
jgi:DNA-binding NarL/FixJ family response regulator